MSKTPFEEFFTSLGYEVSWDYCGGDKWWEILKDGKLVCQVDEIAPLEDVISDFYSLYLGIPQTTIGPEYTITAPDSPELTELFQKTYLKREKG
jgi:hypothetical protein